MTARWAVVVGSLEVSAHRTYASAFRAAQHRQRTYSEPAIVVLRSKKERRA